MSDEIIDLHRWFTSPPGQYLLAWEQARLDEAVADIFGYHGLQIGIPMLDGLRTKISQTAAHANGSMQKDVEQTVGNYLYSETQRRPMVFVNLFKA